MKNKNTEDTSGNRCGVAGSSYIVKYIGLNHHTSHYQAAPVELVGPGP